MEFGENEGSIVDCQVDIRKKVPVFKRGCVTHSEIYTFLEQHA